MTLSPSDSPDWTGIPGALRYLGTLDMSGAGNIVRTLPFAPASYDGAVYIYPSGSPTSGDDFARVQVQQAGGAVVFGEWRPYQYGAYQAQPFASFVSGQLSSSWEVRATINLAASSDWKLYVFAAPAFPLVAQVAATPPPTVGLLEIPPAKTYWQQSAIAPGAGAAATITLAAAADQRWVIDYLCLTLENGGAAATGGTIASVVDSSTGTIFTARMSVPGVANTSSPPIVIGPGWGLSGAAGSSLVVGFPAGLAGTFLTVALGAYQLAGFQ